MPADFPVPRSEIPRVEVSHEEYVARKIQMEGMVERMVQEYEEYSEVNKRHINLRRWKQVGSRERCKLYRERPKYQTTVGALGAYGSNRKYSYAPSAAGSHLEGSYRDDVSEDSYAGPSSSRSSTSSIGSGGFTRGAAAARSRRTSSSTTSHSGGAPSKLDPQNNAAVIADTMPAMLMIGERPGRLEDAMHSLVARNHEELAFVVVFLHKEVADCAILNTMEAPTEEEPYRYLGYKWFVKPSPASAISKLVKNRDSIYVEYTGVTATRSGEVVGFHIMHSIDVDGFPDFHDRNCVRTSQSMCSIYYQKEENMVEFFMMGNVDIGGTVGQSPFKSIFIADTMFGMPRSIDAGEAKRLTQLVVDRRRSRAASGRHKIAPLCRLCRSEKKSYNMVSLVMCEICGHTVCTRCRVHKEVFESDGLLGRFNKFDCCKTCVVDISNTHLPNAQPQANRMRGIGPVQSALGVGGGARAPLRGRNWTATSSTLYEDEIHEGDEDEQDSPGFGQQHLQHHQHGSQHGSQRDARGGKLSVASTAASTAQSDLSSHRTVPNDLSFDSRESGISDISEFDRSFAIVKNPSATQAEAAMRETSHRDTEFSIDDYDDDWQPEFAKSQINTFSKTQIRERESARHHGTAPGDHRNDMVLYNKSTAGAHHHSNPRGASGFSNHRGHNHFDHHHAIVPRSGSARSRHHSEESYQYEHQQQYQHHQRQQHHQPRGHVAVHNSAPVAGPPNLQRHHSAGSDYSRDDLINRMQHLAQLAEATYNTTRDNESRFHQTQHKKQPPVENRNRFFYY